MYVLPVKYYFDTDCSVWQEDKCKLQGQNLGFPDSRTRWDMLRLNSILKAKKKFKQINEIKKIANSSKL